MNFLFRTLYSAAFFATCATWGEAKPSFLFILSDDHAVQSVGCMGSRFAKFDPTPHIDKLAEEGVRFSNSFVANSICSPSRASILTGKHSHANGVRAWEAFDGSQQTMPKLLQKAGYHTVLIGKWHLKSDPTGFDEWTILPGQGDYFDPMFYDAQNDQKDAFQKKGYVAEIITRTAEEVIRNHDSEKPLALFVHHKSVHTPFLCDPRDQKWLEDAVMPEPANLRDEWGGRPAIRPTFNKVPNIELLHRNFDAKGIKLEKKERYVDPSEKSLSVQERNARRYPYYVKSYLRTARSIDRSVGELVAVLEEEGLREKTVVTYMSDQGFYLGEHGMSDKRWAYEESMRTPLVISAPGGGKGSVLSDLVMNIDIAPTLLDFAGASIPKDIQGRSLRPLIVGGTEANWRASIYYRYYDSKGYRIPEHQAVRTLNRKLIYFPKADRYELFDLKNDPVEMKNLATNPANTALLDRMKEALNAAQKNAGDSDPDIFQSKP